MSLSVALVLVVLVSLTSAVPLQETCRKFPAKHDFDVKAYFTGKWYETHGYAPGEKMEPELNMCTSTKAEILRTLIREVYSVYVPAEDKFVYAEGFISLKDFEHGDSKYVEEMRVVDKDGKPLGKRFDAAPITIIDTDYENYSVLYFCAGKTPGKGLSTYFVFSRNQDPEQVHPNVKVVLEKIGLKFDDFISTKGVKCKEDSSMNL